jgi:TPR repeat protein
MVRYLRLAAAQGHAGAECALGGSFWDGAGVAQDFAEAVRWWRKAAAQNDAIAMGNLCMAYYLGLGVERSFAEARAWLARAKEAGHDAAQLAVRANDLKAFAASAASEATASVAAASAAGDSSALLAALRIGADAEDGPLTRKLGLAILRGDIVGCARDLAAARTHLERASALGGVPPAERDADLAELVTAEAARDAARAALRAAANSRMAAVEAAFLARKAAEEAKVKADLDELIREEDIKAGRIPAGALPAAGAGAGAPPAELLPCAACRAGKPADEYSKTQLRAAAARRCKACIEDGH